MWSAVDGIVPGVGVVVGGGIQAAETMGVGITEAGRNVGDRIALPFIENRRPQRGNPAFHDRGGLIAARFYLIVTRVARRVLRLSSYV